jgi:hypothetical protein
MPVPLRIAARKRLPSRVPAFFWLADEPEKNLSQIIVIE